MQKPATRSKRKGGRHVGRRATDLPIVSQEKEYVHRNEYLVRMVQSHMTEVKVFATSEDVAQELAANGLGIVTESTLVVSETKSITQIG